ncbi:uncharacterized protein LOC123668553 [Melitaea cinxia]|uniref:uncharacterized protein LOC123668553 n=1 Tax=Melitaea cinxia TaxID=113334 RepID=UPI001E27482D|nr:uncharacterized protein LOC123668553 [Melitaea cinxia]
MSVTNVNTVKCTNCNIVISEVLAFIRNRHDVVDNESLIRICSSAFSEEEIDEAKKLLFVSTKTTQKLVSRRKNKKQKDLEDMISVFKTMDPEQIPIFVAYDLHKLPPICFDHVDVTKLLKDLLVLKSEINDIKDSYVTKSEFEEVKLHNEQLKTPLSNLNLNNNLKRGYVKQNESDDTLRVQPTSVCTTMSPERISNASTYNALTRTHSEPVTQLHTISVTPRSSAVVVETTDIGREAKSQRTLAQIVNNNKTGYDNKKDNEWTIVKRRNVKKRFAGMTGKAVSNSEGKFKAAELKIPLFISYVSKETTVTDICEYIKMKSNEEVILEKINMRRERPYNAFKVYIPKNKISTFLDDKLWPEGITFRRFINFKNSKDTRLVDENKNKSNL